MRETVGDYPDWRSINYKPAIAELLPAALLPYLSSGQTALDVGCNTGSVALFLAKHGLSVLGVDINPESIRTANERAEETGLRARVRFIATDVTAEQNLGAFDAVLMIRLLTCFPSLHSWRSLLRRAGSLLKDEGIIYINDFKIAENSEVYRERYAAGARLGWRTGNFAVNDKAGRLLFIAHHHSEQDLEEITSPYSQLELNFRKSLSMNGNECEMFEFIGRRLRL
ncbi:MAG TPA: class I SAM-dependent methyltransferase [Pyrinomonadaceae bacterium]|jgi:cyclopropane fatty-acyl-phospholipid synthase-like methyltransferase